MKVNGFGLILPVCLFLKNVFHTESSALSCKNQNSCRCTKNVLSCWFNETSLIVPMHIELKEGVDTVLIQGRNYTVQIPNKISNISWAVVQHLEITGNKNNLTLTYAFLNNFGNIKTLRLRNSCLIKIERFAFSSLSSVVEIDISNNSFLRVGEVEKGLQNFSSDSLKIFNMSAIHNAEDMAAVSLTRNLFLPLSSIEVLDISWTRTFKLEASFGLMPNITTFNMSGTLILGPTECFSSLNRLTNLEVLALDHWPTLARDSDVPVLQYNHYVIRRESVRCQSTPFVDNGTGCIIMPGKLKQLYMRYVHSTSFFLSIEKGFCVLDNSVEIFSVRQMKIFQPVNALIGFHKLKLFDMSYLGIYFRTNVLADMRALETLLSPGNKLKEIETHPDFRNLFMYNTNMKFVDLSENELSFIPSDMFSKNPYLEDIDLSRNMLAVIELNLMGNNYLRKINLSNNKLKTIDPTLMSQLNAFVKETESNVEINLSENDIDCDCENLALIRWVQESGVNVSKGSNLICKDTYNTGINMMELNISELEKICYPGQNQQEPSSRVIYITVSIIVVMVFLVVAVGLLQYRRRKCCCQTNDVKLDKSSTVRLEEVNKSNSLDAFVLVTRSNTFKRKRTPQYSVFLAYCHKDKDFVINKLYNELDKCLREFLPNKNEATLTLLYDKNFLPGEDLIDICKAAVHDSYVTVAIVSCNFIESWWCSYEMQKAAEAEVPIIPVFLDRCEDNNLNGILRLIYDHKVRLVWPQNTLETMELSDEEREIIRCLATSIATYVRIFDSKEQGT